MKTHPKQSTVGLLAKQLFVLNACEEFNKVELRAVQNL